jgi:hypothetical protein
MNLAFAVIIPDGIHQLKLMRRILVLRSRASLPRLPIFTYKVHQFERKCFVSKTALGTMIGCHMLWGNRTDHSMFRRSVFLVAIVMLSAFQFTSVVAFAGAQIPAPQPTVFQPADLPLHVLPTRQARAATTAMPINLPLPPAIWSGLSALMALGAIFGFKRWRYRRAMNRD